MAHERHLDKHQRGYAAATLLNPFTPVSIGGTTAPLLIPAGSINADVFGVTGAGTITAGQKGVVYEPGNVVKMQACASVGAGQAVDVGSTNGRIRPAGAGAASGVARFEIGFTESPAGDGEWASVYIRPRHKGVIA